MWLGSKQVAMLSKVHTRSLTCLFGLLVCMICAFPSAAQPDSFVEPPPLALTPGQTYTDIGAAVSFLEVERNATTINDVRQAFMDGAFALNEGDAIDFGMSQSAYWLRLSLRNDGTALGRWVLDTGEPYLHTLDIYLERDRTVSAVVQDGERTPFAARTPPTRFLGTPELTLAPDEVVTLWIHVAADGALAIPFRLIHPDTLAVERLETGIELAIFYTAGLVMIAFIGAFAGILRSRIAAFYAGFFTFLLAYNAQLDGVLFMLVWGSLPQWNAIASHIIGLAAIIFASFMGKEFLSRGHHPVLSKLLMANAAACALYMFAPLVMPLITVKVFAGILVLTFLILQTATAIVALRNRYSGAVFFFLGTMILFLYLGIFTASSQLAGIFPGWTGETFMRYGQLLDGTVFAIAVIGQAWALRREENKASLMAEFRRQQLAATTHDLRQPLLSLKLMLEKLPQDTDPLSEDTAGRLKQALTYLDGIVSQDLEAARPDHDTAAALSDDPSAQEDFSISLILNNVGMMFQDEAEEKGLAFKVIESSATVRANPIALLRVVTNLVSNAVQYTVTGRVVLGARRRGTTLSVEVWDTGAGLTPDDIARIRQPYESNEESRGEGLGLHLVDEVARKEGWTLNIKSTPGKGSVFQISGITNLQLP